MAPALMTLLVLAVLVAAGVALIVLGLRRVPQWATPTCAKCGYDLRGALAGTTRMCPECGTDLTGRKAVCFLDRRASRPTVALGAAVLLLPVLGVLGLYMPSRSAAARAGAGAAGPQRGPFGMSGMTTAEIVTKRLPGEMDSSWVWRELESRLRAGSMSAEDAESAVRVLISGLESAKSRIAILGWAEDFVEAALASDLLTSEVKNELAVALAEPSPVIVYVERVREGHSKFEVHVYPGFDSVRREQFAAGAAYKMGEVRVNGVGVPCEQPESHDFDERLDCRATLPIGRHEVEVDFEYMLLAEPSMRGSTLKVDSFDRWTAPLARKKKTLRGTLEVHASQDVLVEPVTDPEMGEVVRESIRLGPILVRRHPDGKIWVDPRLRIGQQVPISVCFDAAIVHKGTKIGIGGSVHWRSEEQGASGMRPRYGPRLTEFPRDITMATVVLTPCLSEFEGDPRISRAWAGELTFENIPVVQE